MKGCIRSNVVLSMSSTDLLSVRMCIFEGALLHVFILALGKCHSLW